MSLFGTAWPLLGGLGSQAQAQRQGSLHNLLCAQLAQQSITNSMVSQCWGYPHETSPPPQPRNPNWDWLVRRVNEVRQHGRMGLGGRTLNEPYSPWK